MTDNFYSVPSRKFPVNPAGMAFFIAAGLVLALPTAAMAQSAMAEVLCTVAAFFTGNIGRGLATLAIMSLGVGAVLGKVSWAMAVTICVGITIMFNAEAITILILGVADVCP